MNSLVLQLKRTVATAILSVLFAASAGSGELPQVLADVAEEAFIYSYPMLQNYQTLYRMVVKGGRNTNQFYHRSELLDASFTTIVAPNNDTLYSSAWLDLRAGPVEIEVPDIPLDRYWSMQFIDLYANNISYLGSRDARSGRRVVAIVGPTFSGAVGDGVDQVIRSETELVFVIARILVQDKNDVTAVNELQNSLVVRAGEYHLGAKPTPLAFPMYDPDSLATSEFVDVINFLLTLISIHSDDQEKFDRFSRIGIGLKLKVESGDIDPIVSAGVQSAMDKISSLAKEMKRGCNGWSAISDGFGSRKEIGGRYLQKAAAANIGLYGHSRSENISFTKLKGRSGERLDGSKSNYRLRFSKEELPVVEGFWSLTLYRLPEVLFYKNEIERYSIGDRSPDIEYGEDGSLEILVQHLPPSGRAVNWLPAPSGPFVLGLRSYLPGESIQKELWCAPELEEIKVTQQDKSA